MEGKSKKSKMQYSNSAGGPVYFLGLVGSLVYFLQVADSLWSVLFAFVKAVFWPGFLIYDVLKYIN
jgi:hypothetical protein